MSEHNRIETIDLEESREGQGLRNFGIPEAVPEKVSTVRRLAERGLTTVEYAIGLVAAATAALVLLRVFKDNEFFQTLFKWILEVFTNLAGAA